MEKELTVQEIQSKIINLPGRPPAMLDKDLARIYETDTRSINQAVNRNPERFPDDFRFQLTEIELKSLKSQSVISSDTNKLPYAYTHNGCNMMSACLHTQVAIERSVFIMRAFSAMERESFLHRQTAWESGNQITGERFDLSVKRFKVAMEAVRLMGITKESDIRQIANKITKDTTGVDLMAFILPYCSNYKGENKNKIIHHNEENKEDNLIRFVNEWWNRFGDHAVDSAHLYQIIAESSIPIELGKGETRSQKIRLGNMLSKLKNQQVGGYVITDAGKHRNIRLWKLKHIEKTVIDS